MASKLLPPNVADLLQRIARDEIPSVNQSDALCVLKPGWVRHILSDTLNPRNVILVDLSTEGMIALQDHQAAEAAEARKK